MAGTGVQGMAGGDAPQRPVVGMQHHGDGARPLLESVDAFAPLAPDGPRVAIAGGRTLDRDALAWLLRAGGNFTVVGTYATADDLVGSLGSEPPDLALVDVEGPDLTSFTGLAELRAALGEGKLVLLADRVEGRVVRAALEHRVEGVVLKWDSSFDMLDALRHIAAGHSVFPGGWQAAAADPVEAGRGTLLSPRQRQVLDLVVEGLSNEEIAKRLFVSLNTVKFHVRTIYARLGVHNRVEAVQFVARHSGSGF